MNLFAVTVNVNPKSFVSFNGIRQRWEKYSSLWQRSILTMKYVNKIPDHNLILDDMCFEECESGNVHMHLCIKGDIGDLYELNLFFADYIDPKMPQLYQDRLVLLKPVSDRMGWLKYLHKDPNYVPQYSLFGKSK